MARLLIICGGVALFGFLLFKLFRGGQAQLVILQSPRGLVVRGGVGGRSAAEISDFAQTLQLPLGAEITLRRVGGRQQLRFNQNVPHVDKTRLAEFLGVSSGW
jgi:hypothetical protein